MNMPWDSVFSFLLLCLETTLEESNWVKTTSLAVMFLFFESTISKVLGCSKMFTTMFKVLYQQLRSTLTAAFERHLTTEDFIDIGVKPAPRH